VARLTIFAKGNADLRDCLIVQAISDAILWNGINMVLRDSHPGWRAHVRHETLGRSDALLAATGAVPASLDRTLPLGAYPVESQFATRLFDGASDVAVLSIQPDVMNAIARHRGDGHLLHPAGVDSWSAADRAWLAEYYVPCPPLEPEEAMDNLAHIATRLDHVLIFNMSPIVPWERIHNHQGLGEGLAERIRRFNLALIGLSRRTGISIVDVDAVVARTGALRLKRDAVHLTAEGCLLVAEEVARILADRGCLPAGDAAA
jgi:hypothetical protein